MRPLVLYHGSCCDGFTAAWVCWKFNADADFVPVHHGQPPPDVTGRDVVILDFSYKRPVLNEMVRVCKSLVLLDHHKTAEAELSPVDAWPDNVVIRFDMDKAGCRLAWEDFFPGEEVPWLVLYVEDRDLWRWQLYKSREVNAAIAMRDFDFGAWDKLARDSYLREYIAEGAVVLRYQQRQIDSLCEKAVEINLAGHKVLCVNATGMISEVAGKLAEGRPFGASYFIRNDGKRVWSLRSTPQGADVSEVARRFGGGGHPRAAGFEETLPLLTFAGVA